MRSGTSQHRPSKGLRKGALLRLLTLLLVVLQVLVQVWNLSRSYKNLPPIYIETLMPTEQRATTKKGARFSPEWVVQYAVGDEGCNLAMGSYLWRGHGLGSNVNNMLNAWVYALAVEKWSDMAVVINEHQMGHVECREESLGIASKGWECLFLPMPHLCTFPDETVWVQHLMSKNLPRRDLAEAISLEQDNVRYHPEQIVAALNGTGIDHIGALAGMAKYLWSNITPWLQADINTVVRAPGSSVFEQSPFLALHIRRGDKVRLGEADAHDCTEYLAAAVTYLKRRHSQLKVTDIKGIWVASDEAGIVDRVKEIAPKYLPNVDNSTIFWAAGGVEGGPHIDRTATRTDKETYGGFVYTLADLQQCTKADVFVGTFSSNMGRLLVLLRESIGLKPRNSAISLDRSWAAGR